MDSDVDADSTYDRINENILTDINIHDNTNQSFGEDLDEQLFRDIVNDLTQQKHKTSVRYSPFKNSKQSENRPNNDPSKTNTIIPSFLENSTNIDVLRLHQIESADSGFESTVFTSSRMILLKVS
jgi:rRNA processing protein Krr1/Pno1